MGEQSSGLRIFSAMHPAQVAASGSWNRPMLPTRCWQGISGSSWSLFGRRTEWAIGRSEMNEKHRHFLNWAIVVGFALLFLLIGLGAFRLFSATSRLSN